MTLTVSIVENNTSVSTTHVRPVLVQVQPVVVGEPVIISGAVSVANYGLTGNGDETALIQEMIDYASDNGLRVDWPDGGHYEFSKLTITGDVNWYCPGNVTLKSNKALPDGGINGDFQDDAAIDIAGTEIGTVAVAADFNLWDTSVVLSDASAVQVGDLIHLESTRLIPTDDYGRGSWHEGCVIEVLHIDGNTVHSTQPIPYFAKADDAVTGEITAVSGDARTLTVDTVRPGTIRDQACKLTILDGTDSGEERYIVEVDGSDVTISDRRDAWPAGVQAGDTYSWAWETEAHIIRPVTVQMEGVTITRDQINTFTALDQGFRGLRIFGGKGGKFERCRFENFSTTCVRMQKSLGTVFRDCAFDGANRAYNTSGGTGYGLSFEVCSHGVVDNCTSYNCRRGFDATGSDGYSYQNEINMAVRGGGVTYTGADFFPVGDERQTAVGSHGSGLRTLYRDTKATNCYNVFNIRGREETAVNTTVTGCCERIYKLDKTSGFVADGCDYSDIASESRRGTDDRWMLDTVDYGKRLEMIVDLDIQDDYSGVNQNVFRNIRAKGVTKCAIEAVGSNEVIRGLVCENWNIEASAEGTAFTDFRFLKCNSTTTLGNGCVFNQISVIEQPDSGYSGDFYDFIMIPEEQDIEPGEYIKLDGWIWARMTDDAVISVPTALRKAGLSLLNARKGDSRPFAWGWAIEANETDTQGASPTNIDILTTVPTDGTGLSADSFGVCLDNSTNTLTVANGTGLDQTFRMRIE